jgi:hypothetical protein
MLRMPPGGIFRREARWMLATVVLIPVAALVLALLVPWTARSIR